MKFDDLIKEVQKIRDSDIPRLVLLSQLGRWVDVTYRDQKFSGMLQPYKDSHSWAVICRPNCIGFTWSQVMQLIQPMGAEATILLGDDPEFGASPEIWSYYEEVEQ